MSNMLRAVLALVFILVAAPAQADGTPIPPQAQQPASQTRHPARTRVPALPEQGMVTFYMGAAPAQPEGFGEPIWTGRAGAVPKIGEARCPRGWWPAVQGTADAIKGGHLGQLRLDGTRAARVAPEDWDLRWYGVAATTVMGRGTHAAAVYCINPDPYGIEDLKKEVRTLSERDLMIHAKDGKDGEDGDQVYGGIGIGLNLDNGAIGPRVDINFATNGWTGGVSLTYLNGDSRDLFGEHELSLGIRPFGFNWRGFQIWGVVEGWRSSFSPSATWMEQGVGFGAEAGVHPLDLLTDSERWGKALTLNGKWLVASAVDSKLSQGVEWTHDEVRFALMLNLSEVF